MNPLPSPASTSPGPSLIHRVTSVLDPLVWSDLFAREQPLEIELGAGDGSFLLLYATANPDRNFLGVERLLGRLRKIDRKGRRLGLPNLRGLRFEAAYLLRYLLPRNSVEAIHIYFPDPWPKLKHRRYRLVNEAFPELAVGVLRAGGRVHLRTDDADYFAQMERVFGGAASFERVPTPEDLLSVRTDFEETFLAQGIPTRHASFRKR